MQQPVWVQAPPFYVAAVFCQALQAHVMIITHKGALQVHPA